MQLKSKYLLTALVAAGISAAVFPANAATTLYNPGDLLMGFRATGGTGSTSALVVNLGPAYLLRDNTGSSTLIDISSALTSTYGAGWDTRTDLTFGFAGVFSSATLGSTVTNGDPRQAVYFSADNTSGSIGVQGSSSVTLPGSTQMNGFASNVAAYGQSFAAYDGSVFNGGLVAALDTATANTWEDFTAGSSDFGTGSNTAEGVVGTSQGKILDLYRILGVTTNANPTGPLRTGSWEGTISLGSDGVVSFNAGASPVPEPSRALFAAMGLFALIMRRRRA
ncbi:MAG: hypothetical protein R3F13_06490 [Prosthecobacter sp.]